MLKFRFDSDTPKHRINSGAHALPNVAQKTEINKQNIYKQVYHHSIFCLIKQKDISTIIFNLPYTPSIQVNYNTVRLCFPALEVIQ